MSTRFFMSLMILLFPALLYAQGSKQVKEIVRFDFRGMRIGEPLDEKNFPQFRCHSQPIYGRICLVLNDKIGDLSVDLAYQILDQKFVGLTIFFKPSEYSQMVKNFTVKYGSPHRVEKEAIQTRMGASFLNEKAIWDTDSGTLEIAKYGGSIDKGNVNILSPQANALIQKKEQESAAKAAKDL